jgi:hypothetical protein
VETLAKILTVFLAALICLQISLAGAQTTSSFPHVPVSSKILRVQEQAEEVYERSDYKRAFFIYRNELAPIGDKYSQYMVGFMYLAGQWVEEDPVTASAWYRLAAERDTKEFVSARDQLVATLDAEQKAQSDRRYIELRKEFGDLVLLTRAIRRDYEMLRNRTGTRLSADGSPLTIIDPSGLGTSQSGSAYYGKIEKRIKARLEYIASRVRIDVVDINFKNVDLDELEEQVDEYLTKLD